MMSRASSLLIGHSLEIGAKDLKHVAGADLPPNTAIAIAHFPNEAPSDRLRAAVAVKRAGHTPIPHIAARRVPSAEELSSFVTSLTGVADRVFVIAGDPDPPLGPYRDSLAVIEAGSLEGIPHVGIAGYPDGHPGITTPDLWNALEQKVRALTSRGHEVEIVTQFSFDADSVLRWLEELRHRGIVAPVKIGVPGPVSLPGLLYFAARSGVSASASALAKYGTSLSKVIGTVGPLPFIERLAEGLQPGVHGRTSLHFFTFGALHQTVKWINRTNRP